MFSLKQIAEIVDGEVLGEGDFVVTKLSSVQSATNNCISFFYSSGKNSVKLLQRTEAAAVLLSRQHADLFPRYKIIVDNPRLAYAKLSQAFKKHNARPVLPPASVAEDVVLGHHAIIEPGAQIASQVVIGSHVYIGENVTIGEATVIEDQVVIASGSTVGANCYISPGAVIGACGFGYEYDDKQQCWCKIEHLGMVIIGDKVDIGANTTIDRGALDNTVIANGVKLDNQIQVGHNVSIGENTIIAGSVGIAGSASIGARCKIAGRVSISDHVRITDDVTISVCSQVLQDIDKAGVYSSFLPVQPDTVWKKNLAKLKRLYRRQ